MIILILIVFGICRYCRLKIISLHELQSLYYSNNQCESLSLVLENRKAVSFARPADHGSIFLNLGTKKVKTSHSIFP